jgi:hypothetical protein
VYAPTFWPAVGWAQTGEWAVLLRQSTGVRMDTPGALELIAARDARQEGCDVLGGTGSDPGTHRIEWRIVHVADATAAELAAQVFDRPLAIVAVPTAPAGSTLAAGGSLLTIDGGGIVSTIKPAERGAGVIVRVQLLVGAATVHLSSLLPHGTITSADLAERDLDGLPAAADVALDPAGGSLRTLRLGP